MSETGFSGRECEASSDDRNLAMLAYGLLFAAPFVFGLTGLIAVVIAYVRRVEAEPLARSHYRYQIRSFWVSFALSMIAIVGLTVGVAFFFAEVVGALLSELPRDAWQAAALEVDPQFPAAFFFGILAFVIAYILSSLWIIASSVVGMVRLASRRTIGRGQTA